MAENIEYSTTGKPHPYHLVRPSIWPLLSAFAAGLLAVGALLYMKEVQIGEVEIGLKGLVVGFVSVLICMFFWWKDVIYEAVVERAHSSIAQIGLRYGMLLFIMSEVMFFVAFFWAFFASALFPTEALGFQWPPANIELIDPWHLPLLMTLVLLLSGTTCTWAHHAILEGKNSEAVKALGITVALGVIFTFIQVYEYHHAGFGFKDGVYASTFYMATGFHGFHVMVGTIFLIVCWVRTAKGHFTPERHFGFEAAAWYWHFVDVVWLFLFVAIYFWGNTVGIDHTAM